MKPPAKLTFKTSTYGDNDANKIMLMGYLGADLVGFVQYVLTEDGNAIIESITVISKFKGLGFGRLLVAKVEADLKKQRVHNIFLDDVWEDSVGFWRKMGYSSPSYGQGWRKPL